MTIKAQGVFHLSGKQTAFVFFREEMPPHHQFICELFVNGQSQGLKELTYNFSRPRNPIYAPHSMEEPLQCTADDEVTIRFEPEKQNGDEVANEVRVTIQKQSRGILRNEIGERS